MFYAAAFILIVTGFIFPKNKLVTVAMLFLMWVMFAFNTDNADFQNYYNIYTRIGWGDLWNTSVDEEGFIYLCYFCSSKLNLDYSQFLILYSSVCTLTLAITVSLYSKNCNIVLGLFMLYSYWTMICQIRSYFASLLVLIGLYFLFYYDSKKSTFLFFAFVIVGGFFHRTAFFFLPFYLVKKASMKTITIVTGAAFMVFLSFRVPGVSKLLTIFLSQQKINNWLLADGDRSIVGISMLFIVRSMLIVIELLMIVSLRKDKKISFGYFDRYLGKNNNGKLEFDVFAERIFKATVLSFAFVSLEAFVRDYERLFRIVMFFSYALFADFTAEKRVTLKRVPIGYFCYYGFVAIFMSYFLYAFHGWIDGALRPAFENNALLK